VRGGNKEPGIIVQKVDGHESPEDMRAKCFFFETGLRRAYASLNLYNQRRGSEQLQGKRTKKKQKEKEQRANRKYNQGGSNWIHQLVRREREVTLLHL
jgi:hypothetical protein